MANEVVVAPITGTVVAIEVKVGDHVEEDDVLLLIEAMKMENPVVSRWKGTVLEIKVGEKQPVKAGAALMVIARE